MLLHRVLEARDAVEREEPDPEREDVVLVERLLEERVVRAAVDVAVDALVEVDQRALVGAVVDLLELGEQSVDRLAVGRRRPLGREPRRAGLERVPHLREPGQVARRRRPRRTSLAADTPRRGVRERARGAPPAPAFVRGRAAPSAPVRRRASPVAARASRSARGCGSSAWSESERASAASGWWMESAGVVIGDGQPAGAARPPPSGSVTSARR